MNTDQRRAIAELNSHLRFHEPAEGGRSRWHYDGVSLPADWNGCPLVNPLCPDDLCWLPYAHPGFEIGVHFLGTSAEPTAWKDQMELHPRGPNATQSDLIDLGRHRQVELFPDTARWRS